jgi:TATA-box binding protein (TBP) (component of TFIID and TFIIIB)
MKQLSFILGIVLDLEKEVPIGDISISMINTNFSLNASVNLRAVIGKFSNNMFKVTFDPDRYSAVKIKFAPAPGMKQVTASVFSTGRIIVTGAQTLDEIALSYEIINRTITTDALVKPVATPELFDVILGAKFKEWVEILTK